MNIAILENQIRPIGRAGRMSVRPIGRAGRMSAAVMPVWDAMRGPDHSSLLVSVPAEHTRLGTPADYAPARDVPIPPAKSSGRSTCYYLDPNDWLIKRAEGQLEMNATLPFIADIGVVRLEPQYGPVWYVTVEGKRTHTVFDIRVGHGKVVDHDTRVAKAGRDNRGPKNDRAVSIDRSGVVSVKRAAKAAQLKTDELNQLILDQMPESEADFAQLVTEQHLPQWALANFRLIHSVRNDGHRHCEQELRAAAGRLTEPMSIDEFAKPWGGASAVFRTVVFLLFEGALLQPGPGEIDETTMVTGNREQLQ